MGRLLAEWNNVSIGNQEEVCRKARDVCYEISKLFHRTFIREWNKLLDEEKKVKK